MDNWKKKTYDISIFFVNLDPPKQQKHGSGHATSRVWTKKMKTTHKKNEVVSWVQWSCICWLWRKPHPYVGHVGILRAYVCCALLTHFFFSQCFVAKRNTITATIINHKRMKGIHNDGQPNKAVCRSFALFRMSFFLTMRLCDRLCDATEPINPTKQQNTLVNISGFWMPVALRCSCRIIFFLPLTYAASGPLIWWPWRQPKLCATATWTVT